MIIAWLELCGITGSCPRHCTCSAQINTTAAARKERILQKRKRELSITHRAGTASGHVRGMVAHFKRQQLKLWQKKAARLSRHVIAKKFR